MSEWIFLTTDYPIATTSDSSLQPARYAILPALPVDMLSPSASGK
jgi:hypothetical protein